ncbi:MAG TPA: helix-turn-helix domain-containing protein [Methylophaga aminisulfidivorans]|uniref:Helix-turn-helix domain-containing protein n=2 Tax=root TaxID=1 RepID=A0A7C1VYG5_9GAMM|nr:helix-turn-helix domain-containing protein [Methylophaga aminisulfidivorans]
MNKKKPLSKEQLEECEKAHAIFLSKKKELGLSQRKIADKADISATAVNYYFKGVNPLNLPFALVLSEMLGVKISEFSPRLADEASKISKATSEASKDNSNISESPITPSERETPLISWVNAGSFCESPDQFHPGDAEDWIPVKPRGSSDKIYALKVKGDSMTSPYPNSISYPNGWIIIVDPEQEVLVGMCGIFKQPSDELATFKQLTSDAGKLYLKPLNPQFPMIEVEEGMRVCGRVIGLYLDV